MPSSPATEAERVARAALAAHTTPAATGAHRTGFDAVAAWVQLAEADTRGRLRRYEARRALDAAQLTARFVIPGDADWPTALDALGASRPFGLWVRGSLDLRPLLRRTVAVIGNRAASPHAAAAAESIAANLAAHGCTVTASLAHGVESAAHRGACTDGGGPSLAVIPRGLDTCFPYSRASQLSSLLARGGGAVSLYRPGTETSARTLEASAELTAALARAVVLVEGISRSVAMRGAAAAVDLRRHVFALPPQDDTSASASGNTELLGRRQARPCTDAADVLTVLDRCDAHGPCTQADAADTLLHALAAAGIPARRSGHAAAGAQWVSVDCGTARSELRVSGNGRWTARTDYCPADHAGWLAAPPDEDGTVTPVFDSSSSDYAKDTAALIQAIARHRDDH